MIYILELVNVSKEYKRKNKETVMAVDNVSFTLKKGQIYSMVGESGSGKSTVARMINMMEMPSKGEVRFKDNVLNNLKYKDILYMRKNIQLVLQNGKASLNPTKSVQYLIEEPMKNILNFSRELIKKHLYDVMDKLELPKLYLKKRPYELSGGEQQRVCIARALTVSPELIVFDESLSGQDAITRKKLMDVLKNIQSKNSCTMLLITHDIDVALYMSDHILVMKEGKLIEEVNFITDMNSLKEEYSRTLFSEYIKKEWRNVE
ncbi:ABC-type dipeptide/oligopeptide/nickel transport system ATPase subunit [Clostridium tetanomorphum]|uniref:ABC transporter ATP-binding protein n=1 Tax=Clostridium tetanomorphum TaxID=1553 RepID=UPI00044A8FA3|nr:dipeptide/oligopeptide/nickel ABC transporter ATP-binding protein [Clostridium tetanomorphum]KAJ52862.1 hypothetical protein CTM_06015 [Clostridium tetanomorphum DSM 665]MBP1865451.1 ABC-type dipeptide/oligopeptide/nickel transport system ATPase subunit [Clostridium tetanomorphum]NRS84782.1 ABC-type dipeptide/oligopeptide/nickel transport system ATPase subunit [Clostridium tetanomorphum]SQB91713.1 peptide/opine/nickel uptake ABC transporter [Clostridium tetanomorphum]